MIDFRSVAKFAAVMLTAAIPAAFAISARAASLPTRPYLPLDMALKAARAALDKCAEDGYLVSAAIVARSGTTKLVIRADGAGPHTIGSSTGKAFTAASMGRPTAMLAGLIASKPGLAGLRDMDKRLVILGGGLPVLIGGKLVAGIGVGGAPGGHLDEACARAGLDAIGADK